MNILIVGGKFDKQGGLYSCLVNKIALEIQEYLRTYCNTDSLTIYNGGYYEELEELREKSSDYDIVFWWANVTNDLPKVRNIKEVSPKIMLVTSKRNDNDKYSFQELVQKTLAAKANLTFEFSRVGDRKYKMRVFDPLGTVWADTTNIHDAVYATMKRLMYLKSITRQSTVQTTDDKSLVLKWYFDSFAQTQYQSEKTVDIPDEQQFVDIVRKYAHEFQKFQPQIKTTRFVGNASMRPIPPQIGRCGKGMPSFRKDGYIFVSKRNVEKQFIELDSFVPVYTEDDKLYYCGNDKPSVDTPVQVKLYEVLPNIRYILHSHCYLEDASYTNKAIPCGAIEEADEILSMIQDKNGSEFKFNLLGHGSIIMASDLSSFDNLRYKERRLPEYLI